MNTPDHAIILLSGGMDSATCLGIAQAEGLICHTLAFDYGQRHRYELQASAELSIHLGAVDHRVIHLDVSPFAGSALTDSTVAIPEQTGSAAIPATYVPARNTVFLAMALGYAEVRGANQILIGVNAVDYSGYPDCRPAFIEAFGKLAALATRSGVEGHPIQLRAPLQHLSKADIVHRGLSLGIDFRQTVSCYQADDQGRACGRCDACRLRRQGFMEAGVDDSTNYI
ncbi:MAG: 7-cyano-7-deazaguanine synthase QueC [Pseudomonadales bacterium]|nr:7-cyano-7-deazaguanine synthase QueC [Pseudomonadales bacterium]